MSHKTKLQRQQEAEMRALQKKIPVQKQLVDDYEKLLNGPEEGNRFFITNHAFAESDYNESVKRLKDLEALRFELNQLN